MTELAFHDHHGAQRIGAFDNHPADDGESVRQRAVDGRRDAAGIRQQHAARQLDAIEHAMAAAAKHEARGAGVDGYLRSQRAQLHCDRGLRIGKAAVEPQSIAARRLRRDRAAQPNEQPLDRRRDVVRAAFQRPAR